jgi:hypothetical protein
VVGVQLNDVTVSAGAESCLDHRAIKFLTQEEYFGFGSNFANSQSSFNPIQLWEADIQENQVRLQLLRFPNCFESVRRNADNLEAAVALELLEDTAAPIGKIIYHENTDNGRITDTFSCLEFKTERTNGLKVVNGLLQGKHRMRE